MGLGQLPRGVCTKRVCHPCVLSPPHFSFCFLPRAGEVGTVLLGWPVPSNMNQNKPLFFKSPSLGYPVTAAGKGGRFLKKRDCHVLQVPALGDHKACELPPATETPGRRAGLALPSHQQPLALTQCISSRVCCPLTTSPVAACTAGVPVIHCAQRRLRQSPLPSSSPRLAEFLPCGWKSESCGDFWMLNRGSTFSLGPPRSPASRPSLWTVRTAESPRPAGVRWNGVTWSDNQWLDPIG